MNIIDKQPNTFNFKRSNRFIYENYSAWSSRQWENLRCSTILFLWKGRRSSRSPPLGVLGGVLVLGDFWSEDVVFPSNLLCKDCAQGDNCTKIVHKIVHKETMKRLCSLLCWGACLCQVTFGNTKYCESNYILDFLWTTIIITVVYVILQVIQVIKVVLSSFVCMQKINLSLFLWISVNI